MQSEWSQPKLPWRVRLRFGGLGLKLDVILDAHLLDHVELGFQFIDMALLA